MTDYIVKPFRKPRTAVLDFHEIKCPVCGNEDQDRFLTVTSLGGTDLRGFVCGPCEDRVFTNGQLTDKP